MVERYHPTSDSITLIAPHSRGDYVRYSDYAAAKARIAALETQLAERVRVKPLVWKPLPNTESESGYGAGRSEYPLIQTENGWRVYCIPGEGDSGIDFPTKEAAKAAAQADFERRILSALEAAPSAALEAQLAELAEVVRILSDQESGEVDRRLALKDASRILSALEADPAPKVTEAMVDVALKAFHSVGQYSSERARIKAALTAAQEEGR